jgi:hypothetical protein
MSHDAASELLQLMHTGRTSHAHCIARKAIKLTDAGHDQQLEHLASIKQSIKREIIEVRKWHEARIC